MHHNHTILPYGNNNILGQGHKEFLKRLYLTNQRPRVFYYQDFLYWRLNKSGNLQG